jgi:hypothetical protein
VKVEVKREIALQLIKNRDHEGALKYLSEVQDLERNMYGVQSIQLGRTLKALGTVYMLKGEGGWEMMAIIYYICL